VSCRCGNAKKLLSGFRRCRRTIGKIERQVKQGFKEDLLYSEGFFDLLLAFLLAFEILQLADGFAQRSRGC